MGRQRADPEVPAAARMPAFDQRVAHRPRSLARRLDAGHLLGLAVREVDVDEGALGPAYAQQPADDVGRVRLGRCTMGVAAVEIGLLAEGDRGETQDRRFHRGREIGRATSELQSLMRISYAVFCLKKNSRK